MNKIFRMVFLWMLCIASAWGVNTEVDVHHFEDPIYLEGYVQSLVDSHYYQYRVVAHVEDGKIILSHLPENQLTAEAIVACVEEVTGVEVVQQVTTLEEVCCCEEQVEKIQGVWFPCNDVLFAPLVADPRQVTTSVGYRLYDQAISKYVIAVSLGDIFPIYRWRDVWRWHGDLQFDVETGIWSVFDPDRDSFPLVNSDFHVAGSFSYAVRKWVFRLRVAHQSSHLGDEYLLNHPTVVRVNPSRNSADLYVSHQASDSLRIYAGVGYANNDASYDRETFYGEGGLEVRVLGHKNYYTCLYGTPYFAMHFRAWRDPELEDWDYNSDYVLGFEWSKLRGIGRKVRFYMLYHDGYSLDGQFSRTRTDYLGFGIAYGY